MTLNEAKKLEHSSDPAAREAAKRRLAYAARQKAMRKSRRSRAPGPTKEVRQMERKIRLKVAAAVVISRANGACEVCGRTDLRLEFDHLVSGGMRRHRESSETLLHVCCDCHRAKHRNDLATLRAYRETCARLSMRPGVVEMERRIAKVEEARRASGGTP